VVDVMTGEEAALRAAAARLCTRFPELPPEVVTDALRAAHARFEGRPIRDFVPLLVERAAAAALMTAHVPA